jgi:hypothetical protein
MQAKNFLNSIAKSEIDILQLTLDILAEIDVDYCLIGGLAVNAYAEPVVSLDLDIVVTTENIDGICDKAKAKGLEIQKFEHSINLTSPKSDLRIQIQTDPRYQEFISHSAEYDVMGYRMKVASAKNILQGKIWAYMDKTRRKSKRQKDLADIIRLVEAIPTLENFIPQNIREKVKD